MSKAKPILVFISLVAAVGLSGVFIALAFVLLSAKRELKLFNCGKGSEVEYILATGNEYVIVNPSHYWGRNSFLISSEAGKIPRNWLFRGIPISSISSNGFALQASDEKPIIKSLSFDVKTGSLVIHRGEHSPKRESLICGQSNDYEKVQSAANNFPVEYLFNRRSWISFLNPRLGQPQFNQALFRALRSKNNAAYGIYQLLSVIPRGRLSNDEALMLAQTHKELIKANTSEVSLWEFAGTYRYSWQFAAEQGEANLNAGNWCRSQSSSDRSQWLSKGFKLFRSTPEIRSTNGWIRQNYPDGRFSGYVNYQAECDGKLLTLTRPATVDNDFENSLELYD